MKKFLIKMLIYTVICLTVLNLVSAGSLFLLRHTDIYKPSFVARKYSGTHFDYIALGSSKIHTGIDTRLSDSLLSRRGINLGVAGMFYEGQQMMLEFMLDHGITADYCIIGVDGTINREPESTDEYIFMPFIDKAYIYRYFSEREEGIIKPRTWSRYLPMFSVGYYNLQLFPRSLLGMMKPSYRSSFDEFGNHSYPVTDYVSSGHRNSIVLSSNRALLNIERICREHGIRMIYYIPPTDAERYVFPKQWQSKDIVDLSCLFVGEEEYYMHDNSHINYNGIEKATRALCDSINRRNLMKRSDPTH